MSSNERGSGTVLSVGMCLVLLVAAWAAAVCVAWLGAARSAQSAADLAALAGVGSWQEGGQACAAARRAAQLNHARLDACETFSTGAGVVVEVTVTRGLEPALPIAPERIARSATAGDVSP